MTSNNKEAKIHELVATTTDFRDWAAEFKEGFDSWPPALRSALGGAAEGIDDELGRLLRAADELIVWATSAQQRAASTALLSVSPGSQTEECLDALVKVVDGSRRLDSLLHDIRSALAELLIGQRAQSDWRKSPWPDDVAAVRRIAAARAESGKLADVQARQALLLTYDAGLNPSRVAYILGISEVTVSPFLSRAESDVALRLTAEKVAEQVKQCGLQELVDDDATRVKAVGHYHGARVQVWVSVDVVRVKADGRRDGRGLKKKEKLDRLKQHGPPDGQKLEWRTVFAVGRNPLGDVRFFTERDLSRVERGPKDADEEWPWEATAQTLGEALERLRKEEKG